VPDFTDRANVAHVLYRLRELGFGWKLNWKCLFYLLCRAGLGLVDGREGEAFLIQPLKLTDFNRQDDGYERWKGGEF
jgi:hypothetical protein